MNSTDFKDFIDSRDEGETKGERLSFAGNIPYNELNYAPGSMGYHQAMDRIEFMIENWYSHICAHPVFKNPDPELDRAREQLVKTAQHLFEAYNELGTLQFKKEFDRQDTSYTKLGVH